MHVRCPQNPVQDLVCCEPASTWVLGVESRPSEEHPGISTAELKCGIVSIIVSDGGPVIRSTCYDRQSCLHIYDKNIHHGGIQHAE